MNIKKLWDEAYIIIIVCLITILCVSLLCTFPGLFIGLFLGFIYASNRYKQGQIDALNGKIKYEKKKNSDGEEIWTEIK